MRLQNLIGMALMAGAGLSACAHVAGAGQTADEQNDNSLVAAELKEHHRHHHRGSVTQFITMSLDTLGEDDAQRPQVEHLQAALNVCLAPTRAIETKLMLTVADALPAGDLPVAKIDEAIAQLSAASGGASECSVDTLNRLHALLTPAEREVVADKVQAHWELWREVNDEGETVAGAQAGRLVDLTDQVHLTPGQVEQMSAALNKASALDPKFDEKKTEAHVLAFASAFVFEAFDARSVVPDESTRFAAHGARRMARFYETVTPFLLPEQRTALAAILRDHANNPTTVSSN